MYPYAVAPHAGAPHGLYGLTDDSISVPTSAKVIRVQPKKKRAHPWTVSDPLPYCLRSSREVGGRMGHHPTFGWGASRPQGLVGLRL